MQIVIDIPEDEYTWLKEHPNSIRWSSVYTDSILNGTPLPKGHGRLIDADNIIPLALKKKTLVLKDTDLIDIRSREFVIDYLFKDIEDYINNMPTIIEADIEDDEDEYNY